MKKIISYILILSFAFLSFAQTPETKEIDNKNTNSSETKTNDTISNTNEKQKKSEYEKKLETLKYGLTSDIVTLVGELQSNDDLRFNDELKSIFSKDKNVKLKNSILAFFIVQKNDVLKTEVTEALVNFYDYGTEFLKACIQYLTELKVQDATVIEALHKIIDENKTEIKELAIIALGKLGSSEDAVYLTEVFKNDNDNEATLNLIFKQAIMLALIDLHANETFDFLKEIAEDTYENAVVRARAITALGKIGNTDAIEILIKAFEADDPLIREATVAGLSGFSNNAEVDDLLLQAFKDDYYKVRLKAIETARESKNNLALPFILYRAKTDPEVAVKNLAIETLAEFNDAESKDWLKEVFVDEKNRTDLRVKVAKELLKNDSDFIISEVEIAISTTINDRQKKRFAYELGKNISKIEDARLAMVCEQFLNDKESAYKSIGLDMFQTNKFSELIPLVQSIAEDKKSGVLKARAERLLEAMGVQTNKDDENATEETELEPKAKDDTTKKTE
ncbi:MAG: HEAT repeat domain-containing protein [Treponemataceae bacterium]